MTTPTGRVVVTGGAGFVGRRATASTAFIAAMRRLGLHIASQRPDLGTVVLFDIKSAGVLPEGVESIVGDVSSKNDVTHALRGATLVFHIASYGMSGYESMHEDRVHEVNVQGTENVIKACQEHGVGRLIYISSYNAVFDGVTPIVAGDEESTRYVTRQTTWPAYSITKAIAEQAVLEVDNSAAGTQAAGDGAQSARLRTCAIRPGGIWGPGEQRYIPRIVQLARQGWLQFVFGDPGSLVDWVHVDNLISALLLAADKLAAAECVPGGRAYFVHDEEPENNFEFLRPIMQGLGYTWPTLRLPYRLVHAIAAALESAAELPRNVLGRVVYVPILSRMEVSKCAITHYAKQDRAVRELGYTPAAHSKEEVVQWYKARGYEYHPPHPVVVAKRYARNTRVCIALLFSVWLIIAWYNVSRKGAAADQLAAAGGGSAGEL